MFISEIRHSDQPTKCKTKSVNGEGRRQETRNRPEERKWRPHGGQRSVTKRQKKLRARRRGYKRHPRSRAKARYTQEIGGGKKRRITFREGRQSAAAAAAAARKPLKKIGAPAAFHAFTQATRDEEGIERCF